MSFLDIPSKEEIIRTFKFAALPLGAALIGTIQLYHDAYMSTPKKKEQAYIEEFKAMDLGVHMDIARQLYRDEIPLEHVYFIEDIADLSNVKDWPRYEAYAITSKLIREDSVMRPFLPLAQDGLSKKEGLFTIFKLHSIHNRLGPHETEESVRRYVQLMFPREKNDVEQVLGVLESHLRNYKRVPLDEYVDFREAFPEYSNHESLYVLNEIRNVPISSFKEIRDRGYGDYAELRSFATLMNLGVSIDQIEDMETYLERKTQERLFRDSDEFESVLAGLSVLGHDPKSSYENAKFVLKLHDNYGIDEDFWGLVGQINESDPNYSYDEKLYNRLAESLEKGDISHQRLDWLNEQFPNESLFSYVRASPLPDFILEQAAKGKLSVAGLSSGY